MSQSTTETRPERDSLGVPSPGRVLRLSSIYLASDLLTRGLGLFAVLAIYAVYLSPSEYGILSVAGVVITMTTQFFALGLGGAALKFHFDLDRAKRQEFYGTLAIFLVLVPGAMLAVAEWLGRHVSGVVLSNVPFSPYVQLALVIGFVNAAFATLPPQILRASERAWAYAAYNVLQFALGIGLAAWFVAAAGHGVSGALWAQLLAAIGGAVLSAFVIRGEVRLAFHPRLLRPALVYSLPLVPHFLAHWVLASSDRMILEKYVPLAEVGVYSLAYQVASLMMLYVQGGAGGIIPVYGRLDRKDESATKAVSRLVTYFVLVLVGVGLAIALPGAELIRLVMPGQYAEADRFMPWIVLAQLMMGLYLPSTCVLNLLAGQTWKVAIATIGAALLNVALNLWLIPHYGTIAAAVTTAVAYSAMALFVFLLARGKNPVPYEYMRLGIILGSVSIAFLVGRALPFQGTIPGLSLRVAACLILPCLLWLSGSFQTEFRVLGIRAASVFRRGIPHSARGFC